MKKRKLVRDKIPDLMISLGQIPNYYIADGAELKYRLFQKLKEEVKEFTDNPCEEEMGDIEEILGFIIDILKLDPIKISNIREMKRIERGGFSKKYILYL